MKIVCCVSHFLKLCDIGIRDEMIYPQSTIQTTMLQCFIEHTFRKKHRTCNSLYSVLGGYCVHHAIANLQIDGERRNENNTKRNETYNYRSLWIFYNTMDVNLYFTVRFFVSNLFFRKQKRKQKTFNCPEVV